MPAQSSSSNWSSGSRKIGNVLLIPFLNQLKKKQISPIASHFHAMLTTKDFFPRPNVSDEAIFIFLLFKKFGTIQVQSKKIQAKQN